MLRVCMIAYTHYASDARVRREAEALADRGDQVDVICLGDAPGAKARKLQGVNLIPLSMPRYRGSSSLRYLYSYFDFFLRASLTLTRLHFGDSYHMIQVHTMPDFMVFATLIPKAAGAKIILDVHDLMPELYQSKFGLSKSHWLIRLITWMEKRSISYAHKAIAVHEPHLAALIQHGNPPSKFITLLNLPDPKIFAPRDGHPVKRDGRFKLIYHGTISQRHGFRVAFQALALLKGSITDIDFHLFGIGDDLPHLKQLAAELGLTEIIHIHEEWVPVEDLLPFLLQADVGLIPLLLDDFTKFMLPVKLLEYVALGIPAICSRTATIETYFDDSMVQYFAPGDSLDLRDKILDLHAHPERRKRLAENAKRFLVQHNWNQQKQLYFDLVDNINR